MEAVVLALAALTPWAFGGVDPVFELALAAGLALLLALWAAVAVASGQLTVVRCPVTFVLALLFVAGGVQLLPLPPGLLGAASPGAAQLRAELYPAQPEQLTADIQAPAAPAWPTVTVYPHATRAELARWLGVLILFAAVRNQVASTGSLWRLSLVMLLNGCLLAVFGLAQAFSAKGKVYWAFPTDGVPFGPFINRNHFAAYVNLCFALGVGLLVWLGPTEQDRKQRYMTKPNALAEQGDVMATVLSPFAILHSPAQLWTAVGLALMVGAVMCSLSRGGVVTLFLALLATACLKLTWPIRVRRLEVLIVPALLVVGLFAWIGFRPLESRLGSVLKGSDALAETRWQLWSGLLDLAPRFWLLGSGNGTLGYVEPLTRRPEAALDPATFVDHAHNDYLEALVEGGVVRAGLTLLLVGLAFAAGFRGLRRYAGRTPGALATGAMVGFLAIALHSAVDFAITTPAVAVLAAVVVAQLVALDRADPTKSPADTRADVVALDFEPPAHRHHHRRHRDEAAADESAAGGAGILGPLGRVAVAVTALAVGGLLVAHAWQADRAHRLHLTAFRAAHKQRPDQAMAYLEAAARVAPGDAAVQAEIGQAYLDAGQRERDQNLDDIRRLDHVRLAGLAAGAVRPAAAATAVAAWKDVPRPAPDRVPADRRAAGFARSVVPALIHFAQARRLCALLPKPHMRFAAHAAELVRADPPAAYWRRSLLLAPFDPDLWYFAGVEALRDGHADEAWADWRRSLELTPRPQNDPQLRKYRERLAAIIAAAAPPAGSDPKQRGEQLMARVLPDRPDDLLAAADILDPTASPNGPARPLLDRALALLYDRSEGLSAEESYLEAQILSRLGRDEDAIKAYARALTFAQAKLEWRYQYVKLLIDRGRWKEARRELDVLQREHPGSQQVKDWIAEVDRELLLVQ